MNSLSVVTPQNYTIQFNDSGATSFGPYVSPISITLTDIPVRSEIRNRNIRNYMVKDSLLEIFKHRKLFYSIDLIQYVGWSASEPSDIPYAATVTDITASMLLLDLSSVTEVGIRESCSF